jgi:hypothetical protein
MSTSSPPAGHSMRQQLDELDALLQRMLTLPTNQTDDDAAEPMPARRPIAADPTPTPAPSITRQPRMMLLDGSAPVVPPQSPPATWDPHWNINLNPQQGSSILGSRSPAASDPRLASQRLQPEASPPVWRAETVAFAPSHSEPTPQPPLSAPAQAVGPPIHRFTAPSMSPTHQPIEEPTSMPLLPLVSLNRAFDAVMHCFGPLGQWFCTSTGRNVLGYAGLALLFASAAWGAAGWFGWPR